MRTTAAFNLFCDDLPAQFGFYRALLRWDEDVASRSPIFRAFRRGELQFGLNARPAYALLGLAERAPAAGGVPPVRAYATFVVEAPSEVDLAASRVITLGGGLVKPPSPTYYRQWQAVLADPEGNAFRIAAMALPEGVAPAPTPF